MARMFAYKTRIEPYNINDRMQINLKGYHEGIGAPDYKSYGIAFNAELKF